MIIDISSSISESLRQITSIIRPLWNDENGGNGTNNTAINTLNEDSDEDENETIDFIHEKHSLFYDNEFNDNSTESSNEKDHINSSSYDYKDEGIWVDWYGQSLYDGVDNLDAKKHCNSSSIITSNNRTNKSVLLSIDDERVQYLLQQDESIFNNSGKKNSFIEENGEYKDDETLALSINVKDNISSKEKDLCNNEIYEQGKVCNINDKNNDRKADDISKELETIETSSYEIKNKLLSLSSSSSESKQLKQIESMSERKTQINNDIPQSYDENNSNELKQNEALSNGIEGKFLSKSPDCKKEKSKNAIPHSNKENLKQFEMSEELKELMGRMLSSNSSSFDVSKNKKEISSLKQFKTTEELKELMEKKCQLSNETFDKLLQVKKETNLKQVEMSLELKNIMKKKRQSENKNSIKVIDTSNIKENLKQIKVSKELEIIMERKRLEEEKADTKACYAEYNKSIYYKELRKHSTLSSELEATMEQKCSNAPKHQQLVECADNLKKIELSSELRAIMEKRRETDM